MHIFWIVGSCRMLAISASSLQFCHVDMLPLIADMQQVYVCTIAGTKVLVNTPAGVSQRRIEAPDSWNGDNMPSDNLRLCSAFKLCHEAPLVM